MQQIERSRTITYRWWRGDDKEIREEHVSLLEEGADNRIHEMIAKGYTCGELNDNIYIDDDDPKDGVEYRGWWKMSLI